MFMAFLNNKTESVKLISKVKGGNDGFGMPTYTETEIEVLGVLVEILDSQDVVSGTDLNGKKASFKLHIPKGDTNSWENTDVLIRGKRCRTVGLVDEFINPPLAWNKTIKAERYE